MCQCTSQTEPNHPVCFTTQKSINPDKKQPMVYWKLHETYSCNSNKERVLKLEPSLQITPKAKLIKNSRTINANSLPSKTRVIKKILRHFFSISNQTRQTVCQYTRQTKLNHAVCFTSQKSTNSDKNNPVRFLGSYMKLTHATLKRKES
jgi:hypothetical protein